MSHNEIGLDYASVFNHLALISVSFLEARILSHEATPRTFLKGKRMKSMTFWTNRFSKACVLLVGAAMTMGNQKCEEQPKTPPRALKKIVQLGTIRSSPILFPNGGGFDFQFVANQQIYGVMMESSAFSLKYNPPIAVPPGQAAADGSGFFNLSSMDARMIKASAQAVGKDNYNVQYAKTAWCMVNLPQARIAGSVNSFELVSKKGLSLGFTPAGAAPMKGLSTLGFDVESAQLDVSMIATRPLTSTVLGAANVNSKQTKTKVTFTLNFGSFSIGPSAYFQTPLAKVTKTALENSVNALNDQMKSEEWYTRVLANHDTHIVVVGGADVALEPGDQLLIYNEDYYWEGDPCDSKYLGGGARVGSAVAKIELDWVGDEISRGRVIEQADENAVIGAKVKLFKMNDGSLDQTPGVTPVKSAAR